MDGERKISALEYAFLIFVIVAALIFVLAAVQWAGIPFIGH
jgi:ABC-type transporter Mla subunit MlaD